MLCIECQTGIVGPDSVLPALSADLGDLVPNLRRLLDAARSAGVMVIHATYEGLIGDKQQSTARLWRTLEPATADWAPGHPDTMVIPELLGPDDLIVPRRFGMVPAKDTGLLSVLGGHGVKTVVVTGVSLNLAIVLSTAELTEAGYEVVVPRDGVAGTPADYCEQILAHTISFLGRVTVVDDLVSEWSSRNRSTSAPTP